MNCGLLPLSQEALSVSSTIYSLSAVVVVVLSVPVLAYNASVLF